METLIGINLFYNLKLSQAKIFNNQSPEQADRVNQLPQTAIH